MLVLYFFILLCIFLVSIYLSSSIENKPQEKYYKEYSDFKIKNYLPRHPIEVYIVDPDTQKEEFLSGVEPKSHVSISKKKVFAKMSRGKILRFYIKKGDEKILYSDYVLDIFLHERIKNLHVGMITTRFIGPSTDSLRLTTTGANAGQGNAWLKIHNLTYLPLTLNDDIHIEPHSQHRYLGQFHQGVDLGTIFKDNNNVYPDFQYLRPHSDLYYGIVSDIEQPLLGCWQQEFNDFCEYGQTLWPFQEGIY